MGTSAGSPEDPRWRSFRRVIAPVFRTAQRRAGAVRRRLRIGGCRILLDFAGPALVDGITGALEHHPPFPGSEQADLTVHLWDSVSTGTVLPPPPWSPGDYAWRSEIRGFGFGHDRLAYHPGSGILNVLDPHRRTAFYWTRDARELPYYESGAPLLPILNWTLNARGMQVVHAAAVGTAAGGVLLAGKGGAGKSTTALACVFRGGMAYVADDYGLVQGGGEPRALSLFNTAKLEVDRLRASFPDLEGSAGNAGRFGEEKPLLFLHRHFPDRLIPEMPLRAVLVPRLSGRPETTLAPARPMEALRALAPSTLFQLSGSGEAELKLMADLVRRVPCRHLALGTRLEEIPAVVRRLLEEG